MKTLTGKVLQKSGRKTVSVLVVRKRQHPKYAKTIQTMKKYLAHDEHEKAQVGEIVTIREVRPLSKRKRWILMSNA